MTKAETPNFDVHIALKEIFYEKQLNPSSRIPKGIHAILTLSLQTISFIIRQTFNIIQQALIK